MTISELMEQAHETAVSKGWWDEERNFAEQVALQHSELSEALEDWRDGRDLTEVYYQGEKPCGIPVEYADLLIRVFDTCQRYGIDLEAALQVKMAYNKTRPCRHGGKRA
jgi:NTP pyrophosphatase (non-canonical NTP hydrolase)